MPATIMIVDDDEGILNVFATILQREGYKVVTASDGHEAMTKINSERFDLAIVDINVPGPDGIEILKCVKGTNEDIEVIIMSGHASLDTAIESMRQGAYDYIVKPLDIYTVSDAVKRGLEKQRRAIETKQLLAQLEQRAFELSVLYELKDTVGYTLDYREFVEPIMDSLRRIVDHDASAFLFMTGEDWGELTIWTDRGTPVKIVDQIRLELMKAFNSITADSISEDMISVYVSEVDNSSIVDKELSSELRSFLNVALVIRDEEEDRLAGMINISSYRDKAFDLGTSGVFYNIANNMSNALERLTRVLAGERSKLEIMVRSMTDGVIMFDQRGHISVLNPAARKMLDLQEIVNAGHLAKHIGNSRLSKILDRFWRHRDMDELIWEEDGFEEEVYIQKTRKFLSTSVSHIRGDDNKTYGFVAVLRDITRRKEIDEAKSAFVSAVSHELRTPLTAIKNANSIIEMAGEVNDHQHKFLDVSTRNIDRLERLINRILDFSKLEEGKLKMEFGVVDLKKLAQESISALQNLAAHKSIKIAENIPDGLPQVFADYHRLDQVFTNLLDNAIKYTTGNGQISIKARLVDSLFVDGKFVPMPRNLPNPGFIEVSIYDTGVGISHEDQKRIFGKFEQAGTSYEMGVGLGLSIVKKIIENHYGEIWVESELGKGSKFAFVLPASKRCNKILSLIRSIEQEIREAAADHSSLSLILIQVENFAQILAEHGDSIANEILADIANYAQHKMQIRMAVVCESEDHGLVFCFHDENEKTVASMEEQMSGFIYQQKLPEASPAVNVMTKVWVATYPSDGTTAIELMDAAIHNCIPEPVDL